MSKKTLEKVENTFSKIPNHIDEYLKEQEQNSKFRSSRELFEAGNEDIDLKTDLSLQEIQLINVLFINDAILQESNLTPVFRMYYEKYMRLKVSKDRLSRGEFVKINSEEKTEDILNKASNVQGLMSARK